MTSNWTKYQEFRSQEQNRKEVIENLKIWNQRDSRHEYALDMLELFLQSCDSTSDRDWGHGYTQSRDTDCRRLADFPVSLLDKLARINFRTRKICYLELLYIEVT